MDVGAHVNNAEDDGEMPLFTAGEKGHDAVVKALLDAGAHGEALVKAGVEDGTRDRKRGVTRGVARLSGRHI